MKVNKKYFYTYVKNKQSEKGKIGPFVNKDGNIINDTAANILQDQYRSVWSTPREEDKISDIYTYFNDCIDSDTSNISDSTDSDNIDNINNMSPKIETITFDRTKIRKAISGVK